MDIYYTNLITIDECSVSNVPNNRYIGQVAYEKCNNREWIMHFMAAKRLDALLEVIYIIAMQYLNI